MLRFSGSRKERISIPILSKAFADIANEGVNEKPRLTMLSNLSPFRATGGISKHLAHPKLGRTKRVVVKVCVSVPAVPSRTYISRIELGRNSGLVRCDFSNGKSTATNIRKQCRCPQSELRTVADFRLAGNYLRVRKVTYPASVVHRNDLLDNLRRTSRVDPKRRKLNICLSEATYDLRGDRSL